MGAALTRIFADFVKTQFRFARSNLWHGFEWKDDEWLVAVMIDMTVDAIKEPTEYQLLIERATLKNAVGNIDLLELRRRIWSATNCSNMIELFLHEINYDFQTLAPFHIIFDPNLDFLHVIRSILKPVYAKYSSNMPKLRKAIGDHSAIGSTFAVASFLVLLFRMLLGKASLGSDSYLRFLQSVGRHRHSFQSVILPVLSMPAVSLVYGVLWTTWVQFLGTPLQRVLIPFILSSPLRELQGYWLQSSHAHKKKTMADFFRPANLIRSIAIGALNRSISILGTQMLMRPLTFFVAKLRSVWPNAPLFAICLIMILRLVVVLLQVHTFHRTS